MGFADKPDVSPKTGKKYARLPPSGAYIFYGRIWEWNTETNAWIEAWEGPIGAVALPCVVGKGIVSACEQAPPFVFEQWWALVHESDGKVSWEWTGTTRNFAPQPALPAAKEAGALTDGAEPTKKPELTDEQKTWMSFWGFVGLIGATTGAYHGFKRNDSVGWAIVWALLGSIVPVVTIPVSLAQGFGKRKRG